MMNTNTDKRQLVAQAHDALFNQHDVSALARYFSQDFIEHSPFVADGLAGLKAMVESKPDLQHEAVRILVDGDLVAVHGRYVGLEEQPLVGFDVYRVQNGKIIEHWDGLVPEAPANASGRTQLSGPTAIDSQADTEANRQLVLDFFQRFLIEGNYNVAFDYTTGDHFHQHSPDIADGAQNMVSFLTAIRDEGHGLEYKKVHRTVAEGQFVLTQSEGAIAGKRHAYFELWRVEKGKVAELWDAIAEVPEDHEAVHQHGIF